MRRQGSPENLHGISIALGSADHGKGEHMLQLNDRTIRTANDTKLCRRIQAEYVEMPGLTLTLSQASRLFNLERTRCERLLSSLVEQHLLARSGEMFVRTRVD
jgi:hypothetical protein